VRDLYKTIDHIERGMLRGLERKAAPLTGKALRPSPSVRAWRAPASGSDAVYPEQVFRPKTKPKDSPKDSLKDKPMPQLTLTARALKITVPLDPAEVRALPVPNDLRSKLAITCLVNACDHGRVSPLLVADHMAALNNEVHQNIRDNSVGPRCIVAWRHMRGGRVHNGGGAQQFYIGTARDPTPDGFPVIACGMDMTAFERVMLPHILETIRAKQESGTAKEIDWDKITAEFNRLPNEPDETLR
jgi:hypothetical protein